MYACGSHYENTTPMAAIWIDGTKTDLSTVKSEAMSIAVGADGVVYVSGVLLNTNASAVWKLNENPPTLSIANSYINSIAVSNEGIIYSAGFYISGSDNIAALWKNDTRESLSGGNSAATSIVLNNGNIYIGGNIEHYGAVWKNSNKLYNLNGEITKIAVYNGKVYAAGIYMNDHKYVGTVWVDGIKQLEISDVNEHVRINDIKIYMGSIYAAGRIGGRAAVWLNGKEQQLDGAEEADITCIYVE